MTSHAHADPWVQRLRAAGAAGLRGGWLEAACAGREFTSAGHAGSPADASLPARIDAFRDSAGNRRPADGALLARLLGVDARALPRVPTREVFTRNPDAALWWSLHGVDAAGTPREVIEGTAGPLFPRLHAQGIEMWTEAELSGLHALTWHALREPALLPRVFSAAAWLIDEVQPDNATQHPWGVHVFAWLAADNPNASLYADTLLHNALMPTGTAGAFSAVILMDAAEALEGLGRVAPVKLA